MRERRTWTGCKEIRNQYSTPPSSIVISSGKDINSWLLKGTQANNHSKMPGGARAQKEGEGERDTELDYVAAFSKPLIAGARI